MDMDYLLLNGPIDQVTYKRSGHLFYRHHIPHAGHMLCEGEVLIKRGRGEWMQIFPGVFIGVKELWHNAPIGFSAKVLPGTKLAILDRSTLKELWSKEDQRLRNILNVLIK